MQINFNNSVIYKIMRLSGILILTIFFYGFIPIKYSLNTVRDNEYFVYKDKCVTQEIIISKPVRIYGVIILVTFKEKTHFSITITDNSGAEVIAYNISASPELNKKYQTLKIIFKDEITVKSGYSLNINSEIDYKIWFGDSPTRNEPAFFSVGGMPVKGAIYCELIKKLDIRETLSRIISKYSENYKFNIFYGCLLIISIIAIIYCILQEKNKWIK